MAVPPSVPDESRRTLSLEWKLPLVMTCGIAAALAVLLLSAYFVLQGRSEGIWRDRLGHAIREIAHSVDTSLAQRRTQFEQAARDESVRSVAVTAQQSTPVGPDVAAARATLARLITAGDTTRPVELWTVRGRRILVVGHQQADTLGSVPRSFQDVDSGLAETQLEAILNRHMYKRHSGFCAKINSRSGACGEFFVSGNKIGVQMGFKDMPDGESMLFRSFQIQIDIALRIDHDCIAFRSKHVGGVS